MKILGMSVGGFLLSFIAVKIFPLRRFADQLVQINNNNDDEEPGQEVPQKMNASDGIEIDCKEPGNPIKEKKRLISSLWTSKDDSFFTTFRRANQQQLHTQDDIDIEMSSRRNSI